MPSALDNLIDFDSCQELPSFGWFAAPNPVELEFDAGDDGEDGEGQEQSFKPAPIDVLLYSGAPVQKYGIRMVISLAGMTIPDRQIPILDSHNHGVPIGYADKTTKRPVLRMRGKVFDCRDEELAPRTREAVLGIRAAARQGYNWQASMGVSFQKVTRIPEGESMKVNGEDFAGPGYVVEKSTLLEGSVLALGADGNTQSTLLSLSAERGTVPVTFSQAAEPSQPKESPMSVIALSAFLAAFPDHKEWAASFYAKKQDAEEEFTINDAKAELFDEVAADNAKLAKDVEDKQKRLDLLANEGVNEDDAPGFSGDDDGNGPAVMEFEEGEYSLLEFLQEPEVKKTTNVLLADEFAALPRSAQKTFGSVDAYRLFKTAKANGRVTIKGVG